MTLQEETPTESALDDSPAPISAAAKPDRASANFDYAARTVTVTDAAEDRTHSLAGIPDNVALHLTLMGLQRVLESARDPAGTLARMKAGELPGRGPAKPRERDPRRVAYAQAKMEIAKKAGTPMTEADALAAADALDAAGLKKAMLNHVVVKHHGKITGAGAELI